MMFRRNTNPTHDLLIAEIRAGGQLLSPRIRLAGLCTLFALIAWIYGGFGAVRFITTRIALVHLSHFMGAQAEMQETMRSTPDLSPATASHAASQVEDPVAEGVRLLNEQRQLNRALQEERAKESRNLRARLDRQSRDYRIAQGTIMVSWLVVTTLAGVFMLCAAIAGLTGSMRTRLWHRLVVYWTILATACTIAGMLALVRWGGFPEIHDLWILAKIAGVQCSYAAAITLALLITRHTAAPRGVA